MLDSICVNYRTPKDFQGFVNSWLEDPVGKLILIDVDPLEGQEIPVGVNDHPDISYVPFHWNCGYSGAINWGAAMGDNPILAAFNADVILKPGALKECAMILKESPSWGVLGPHQVDEAGLVTHAGIFGTNEAPQFRTFHTPDKPMYHDVQEAVTVSGSAYFVKREVWDILTVCPIYRAAYPDVGGAFLPTPHYYEETFCSYHARAHGYKVIYYGLVSVIHKWHQASPVGGWAEKQLPISQKMFREMCDLHNIPRD